MMKNMIQNIWIIFSTRIRDYISPQPWINHSKIPSSKTDS
ncbi:hypothetical protein Godav_001149 [Gossypium davidsonii]|uniref:Uncharacterized protein n=2 Tax=Gossypium TaxID=3633 RepID=A0A7J8T3N7_GOSDV|nr:hypothetical protein [Gossypium davidsonii]MBA0668160.1 hypothetical protein [Gossypium klotzschianum]